MKKAVIDLTNCKSVGEIHLRIKEALDFPDGYGEHWDAFWDMLSFDSPDDFITVKGVNTMSPDLIRYIQPMKEILEEHKQHLATTKYPFDYEFID